MQTYGLPGQFEVRSSMHPWQQSVHVHSAAWRFHDLGCSTLGECSYKGEFEGKLHECDVVQSSEVCNPQM
jgi:hypothetical protein